MSKPKVFHRIVQREEPEPGLREVRITYHQPDNCEITAKFDTKENAMAAFHSLERGEYNINVEDATVSVDWEED